MIVKGLDFDNVTLVGILLADASLNFPDINAAARTFQLTSQAAGRAGRRDRQGRVIMQTYTPKNETLVYCARHDYEGFYAYDIAHRRKMDYPPFSEVIGVFVASEDIAVCMKDCEYIYKRLNDIANAHNYGKIKIYAPTPAFIQKLKNKYIYHTLVRYETDSGFKADFRKQFNQIKQEAQSNVFVEINPITLL
jgi:primosomal protein N' (replication factor Y)